MKSNTRIKTVIFLIFSGLFLMQDKLQEWFAPFQYFDEAFGLLLFPMVFLRGYQKRLHPIREKGDWLFYAGLAIFWIFGWAGYLYYRYQPLSNALKDFYVNCKFFFALGTSYLFFDDENLDFEQMKEKIWPVLGGVTVLLFAMTVLDLFFDTFSTDTRGPFRAVKLFYSVQTVLVAVCVFLSSLYLWYYEKKKNKILLPVGLLSIIMFCTLRVKSMGAIAAVVLIYLFVLRGLKFTGLKRWMKITLVAFLVFAAAAILYQIANYYVLMGVESARAMLTLAGPFVAWDHFPFGSGWATFGSAFSAEPYSPVYGMYRMAGIWGLSPDYPSFVSDTYWPMILGQTGFFGFAGIVMALIVLVKKVLKTKEFLGVYAAGLLILAQLLISSTSESALANPMAVPMALLLGLLLAEYRNRKGKGISE